MTMTLMFQQSNVSLKSEGQSNPSIDDGLCVLKCAKGNQLNGLLIGFGRHVCPNGDPDSFDLPHILGGGQVRNWVIPLWPSTWEMTLTRKFSLGQVKSREWVGQLSRLPILPLKTSPQPRETQLSLAGKVMFITKKGNMKTPDYPANQIRPERLKIPPTQTALGVSEKGKGAASCHLRP